MRAAALILSGLFVAALAMPAQASTSTYGRPVADPPLRYSAEIPPGEDGTPPPASLPDVHGSVAAASADTAPSFSGKMAYAEPVANPPLRYSAEIPPGEDDTPPPPQQMDKPQTQNAAPTTPVQTTPVPPVQAPTANAQPAASAPPLRYSVESDGSTNQPRYTVGRKRSYTPPPQAPAPSQQSAPQQPAPVQHFASASPAPEAVTVRGYRGYRLGPGDKVHVTVFGEADLTGDFEVSGTGHIAFPLIGEVHAAGLTASQLGDSLSAKLANGYLKNPRVAVEVSTYRPFYVIGQVNKPGSYPYSNGMTAINAVAMAGGFTPSASDDYVYVRHAGQAREVRMPANDVTEIEPGDVVRVRESAFWSVMSILSPLTAAAANARYGLP